MKRRTIDDSEMADSIKMWKENPPGQEQIELDRMFEKRIIDSSDTPNQIRLLNPIFKEFNARTFAFHFRKTKAKFGLNAVDKIKVNDENIPELYGTTDRSNAQSLSDLNADSCIDLRNLVITWTYTDHLSKCDIVCVAMPIISGSREVHFSISEDGMKLFVHFIWPSALYNPLELFKDALQNEENPISVDHPKIHAFTSRLLECEITEKSKPQTSVAISLPVKVQRELGTFSKQGIKSGETKIVMIELKAFKNKKVVSDADTSICFD